MILFTNKIVKVLSHVVNKCSLEEFSDVNHGKGFDDVMLHMSSVLYINFLETVQRCTELNALCGINYKGLNWIHIYTQTRQIFYILYFIYYDAEKKKAVLLHCMAQWANLCYYVITIVQWFLSTHPNILPCGGFSSMS